MSASSSGSRSAVGKPSETVRCVVCRESIKPSAKVCIHCSSAQNWTRHLMRWGTIVGAVISMVSLATAAYSLTKLIPASARIQAVPLACKSESVRIAFTNLGDKAGLVREAMLTLRIDGVDGEKSALASVFSDDGAKNDNSVIEPGKTRVIAYEWQSAGVSGLIPLPSVGTRQCIYSISLETVDFEGAIRSLAIQCSCPAS